MKKLIITKEQLEEIINANYTVIGGDGIQSDEVGNSHIKTHSPSNKRKRVPTTDDYVDDTQNGSYIRARRYGIKEGIYYEEKDDKFYTEEGELIIPLEDLSSSSNDAKYNIVLQGANELISIMKGKDISVIRSLFVYLERNLLTGEE